MASTFKTKLAAAGAWLAPSIVAAFAGALVGGLVEVRADFSRVWIAIGVIAPLAVPVLLATSLVVRALYAAWLPETLREQLREERGSMPRLAAWVGVVWLGSLGLAWAMFQGIWQLASWTAFKATSISFLAPILAVLALLVLVVLSRPAAELFTIMARWIDRRWRRFAPGTLLSPAVIFAGAAITATGVGYLIWRLLVQRRMPDLAPGILAGAVAGIAMTGAVHLAWRGPWIARAIGGGLVIAGAIAIVTVGLRALHGEPRTAIAIWSESRLARLGIERVTDIEEIRRAMPVDAWKPIERRGPHRDILLITIDGARAERTPPYAGGAPMPALAELGRRGAVIEWAFAPSTTERRTIPSLVTGVAPNRIRGRASELGFELDPRHVALAERMRAAGYDTAAFTCCFEDHAKRTWLRGFDHRSSDGDPLRLAGAARDWLKQRSGTPPAFAWIHFQVPWPPDRDTLAPEARLAAYDGGLRTIDRGLATVIDAISSRTVEQSPIVIVAGTRGEELGEHASPFSTDDLFNTQIQVPVVVVGPAIRNIKVADPFSLVDLTPTIIELAGFSPPRAPSVDGLSFAGVLGGGKPSIVNFAFAAIVPDSGTTLDSMMLVRGTWKLIDGGGNVALYDLKTDPDERSNVASMRMTLINELRALLTARIRASTTPPF